MSLLTKKGTLTAKTGSTGTQATTGVGFQPKALILFCSAQTAFGSVGADMVHAVGYSDGTNDYACATYSEDNVGTSNAKRRHASKVITCFDGTGALDFEAGLSSFDADGFTLNYTTVGSAFVIHYFAIGGSDLTNAAVGTFQSLTSLADQSITGLGFQPDALMFIGAMNGNTSPSPAPPATLTNAAFLFTGFATASDSHCAGISSEDAQSTSDTGGTYRGVDCIEFLTWKSSTLMSDGHASLKTMDADGFTLTWNAAPTVACYVGYLALKGGSYFIDSISAKQTSTGTQSYTGYGFQPTGALVNSRWAGALGPITVCAYTFGASSAAGVEGTAWAGDQRNVGTTNANQLTKNDKFYSMVNQNTGVLDSECDNDSFDADGMTLNWTTVGSAHQMAILAMGDAAAAAGRRRMIGQVY